MAPGRKRHNARHNAQKRRTTSATGGLGKWQRRILVWLWQEERRILEAGTPKQRAALRAYGVPYSQKKVLGKGDVTSSERAALSRALRNLESSDRRLVTTLGSTTSNRHTMHVRLSDAARTEAERLERDNLLTADQIERRERAKQQHPSPTHHVATQADAVIIDILRLRLMIARSIPPEIAYAEYQREQRLAARVYLPSIWADVHEKPLLEPCPPPGGSSYGSLFPGHEPPLALSVKLEQAEDRLRKLLEVSPSAVGSALANLLQVVSLLDGLGAMGTQLAEDTVKWEIEADRRYVEDAHAELEAADPALLEELGINLT